MVSLDLDARIASRGSSPALDGTASILSFRSLSGISPFLHPTSRIARKIEKVYSKREQHRNDFISCVAFIGDNDTKA